MENKNKKKIIILAILIGLFILSQWIFVKLVYARKLPDKSSLVFAKIYNLKAGFIEDKDTKLNLYLKDYLENKLFIDQFVKKQIESQSDDPTVFVDQLPQGEELDSLLWHKISKDAWLKKIAKANNIFINQEDLNDYFNSVGGLDGLKNDIQEYDLSFDNYNKLVIEPFVLELKVHQYLLENYHDTLGVSRIQEAYTLLENEDGENFDEVATVYSDDLPYAQNINWLKEEELIDFYQPIKELEIGDFSKVTQIPIGYIIWYLDSIKEEEGERLWGVRGLFVAAQSIEDFLDNYLSQANFQKLY